MKGALASEGNSIYPTHTTEQVILAFFCHKFNTQGDIWDLMKSLDESIVERAKVEERLNSENKEDLILKEGDLEEIINQDVYDLDDILALETADIWSMSTPYRSGSALINNGGALPYDREKDQLFGEEKFADCEGTALRHFLNMLLYNPETRNWDLSHIEKYVEKRM